MSVADEKEFVIKHVFPEVSSMKPCEERYGKKENYFNIPWIFKTYKRYSGGLSIYLGCLKFCGAGDWSINASVNMKLLSKTGEESHVKSVEFSQNGVPYKMVNVIESADLENYLFDGKLAVKMKVKLTKMTGIKEKLSNFDESIKALSDVVLMVNDEKFHVSKNYLSHHSSYFKTLLSGNSKRKKYTLEDVNPHDFQNFLEVIHGEPAVDEDTFDGILHLADKFDSKTAIRRCEDFSLNQSKRSLKRKFNDAAKYKMDNLKRKCIDEMKSKDDIRSVMPNDASKLEASVWKELLDHALSLD